MSESDTIDASAEQVDRPTISIITAVAENGVIGKENGLPWHLPADFRYFKQQTLGKACLVARKTFESFNGALKGRTNIVLTSQQDYTRDDAIVVHSVEEGLKVAAEHLDDSNEIMILGGATLYEVMLPKTDRLYLTRVHGSFEGDTRFPDVNFDEWDVVESEPHTADEKNQCDFTFLVYERK